MYANDITRPTMTEMKRESKSFEAIQQGMVFVVLSSFGYSFELKRPERMAEKTFQYLTILEVFKDGVPLNFGTAIDDFCQKQYEMEFDPKMSKGTLKIVKRRKDLNRTALSFSWMLQYCEQSGVLVNKRKTKLAKKTVQLEKVTSITFPSKNLLFEKSQIDEIGTAAHKHLCSLFNKKEKSLVVPAYYPFFLDLLEKGQNLSTSLNNINTTVKSENTQNDVQTSPEIVEELAFTNPQEVFASFPLDFAPVDGFIVQQPTYGFYY
ncbi:hypothetical protein EIN_061050 [Entamoeba invadens IP1]|uniref:hypothetical protein n=1 Tax=Entamoeba invadens IP1 TaxID=370355 RepID=UPI0002C3E99A|nr:hypothetical protein EIN_061050 [Entamoeba invadens IP1]ELP93540.1 hypothetical protein EIN_061050 [Entamoeba invadens IP1]|eukprot:XP_004260311.1 hypothetical protein EIN_061050 [Entamoeba invadens IP1]